MNPDSNPMGIFDGFLTGNFDYDPVIFARELFKNDNDFDSEDYLVKRFSNWLTYQEYYARFAKSRADEAYNKIGNAINTNPSLKEHYFQQLLIQKHELERIDNYFHLTIRYLLNDVTIRLAERFNHRLTSKYIDIKYIIDAYSSLVVEIVDHNLENLKSWYNAQGNYEKPEHLYNLLNDIIQNVDFLFQEKDFDTIFTNIAGDTVISTQKKIKDYLSVLDGKCINSFLEDLQIDLNFLSVKLESHQSIYQKHLAVFFNNLFDDSISRLVRERYGKPPNSLKKKEAVVKGFGWNGTPKELDKLYHAIHGKLIECDQNSFEIAFSTESIKNNLSIKWLLKVERSKMPEINSIFYFLKILKTKEKIMMDYDFGTGKPSRKESKKFYDQICKIFTKPDGSPINRKYVRNRKPAILTSPNFLKIEELLQINAEL